MKLTPTGVMPAASTRMDPAPSKRFELFRTSVDAAKTRLNRDKSSAGGVAKPQILSFSQPLLGRPLPGDNSGTTTGTVIPGPGTDPAAVSAWWASLSKEVREKLIGSYHDELGLLRGLPAEVANNVNRIRVIEDVTRLEKELSQVEIEIALSSRSPGEKPIPVPESLTEKEARITNELHNARAVKRQMEILDEDPNAQSAYLLTYSPKNEGRFAVALGNPDTAKDTAVLVPGTGHDVQNEDERYLFPTVGEGQRLYGAMSVASGGANDHSVIVWLGTDMPNEGADPLNGTYGDAEHGARWLREDIEGYRAASTTYDSHMTLIAHSYGSYMAGEAAKLGMKVDDLVVFGSPGIRAENAEALGMPDRVWAAQTAEGDWITNAAVPKRGHIDKRMDKKMRESGEGAYYGTFPTDPDFGAKVFSTDGDGDLKASEGHSGYLTENGESLANIAKISVGADDEVSLAGE